MSTSGRSDDDLERTSPGLARTFVLPAAATLLLVALATGVLFAASPVLVAVNLVSIVYLIPVLIAALWWGTWPAVLAAVAGALAADFFFYPPLYSFVIGDTQNIADLLIFLIVALVSGRLAANLRRRERQIRDLYWYSRRLAACFTTADLIRVTESYLSKSLGRPAILIEAQHLEDFAAAPSTVPNDVRREAALQRNGNGAGHALWDRASSHLWLARRVALGRTEYVIFVDLGAGTESAKRRLNRRIDAVLTEVADNLTRLDLAQAIEDFRTQARSDMLKNALVATMSHELRTPLVSILGAASVLEQMSSASSNDQEHALVETIRAEAARLDGNIQNLIEAVSITTGVERPTPELTDPVDMVRAAVALRSAQLAGHPVEIALEPDLPLVRVQAALIENALGQLIDNAAKYSPPDAPIKIAGTVEQDWVVLSVSDRGIGLAMDERNHVGLRSFRSRRSAAGIPGSGLGLWIASTFVAANGGKLDAESPGPGLGTTVRIRLPAQPPPRELDAD